MNSETGCSSTSTGGHLQVISSCSGKAWDEAMTLILDHSRTVSGLLFSCGKVPTHYVQSYQQLCANSCVLLEFYM